MADSPARFRVQPVLHKGQPEVSEQGVWITDYMLPPCYFEASVERSPWEAGIVEISAATLAAVNDNDFLANGGGGNPTPAFPNGWDGSRLDIFWGAHRVFSCDLYGKGSEELGGNDPKIEWIAQSPMQRFRRDTTVADRIPTDATAEQFFRNVLADVRGTDGINRIEIPLRLQEALIIGIGQFFSGRPIFDNLQDVATAFSCNFRIDRDRRAIVEPSSHVDLVSPELILSEPIDWSLTDGTSRIVNALDVKYGRDDTRGGGEDTRGEFARIHKASTQEFDENRKTLDMPYVTDRGIAELCADEILSQNALPRRLLECKGVATDEMILGMDIYKRVRVISQEQFYQIPPGDAVAFGQPLPEVRLKGLNFVGRVLKYKINLLTREIDLILEAID